MDWLTDIVCWWRGGGFKIVISESGAALRRGQALAAFVEHCATIARDAGLESGSIYGIRSHQGLSLRFSRDVPEHLHQRFRNAWAPGRR